MKCFEDHLRTLPVDKDVVSRWTGRHTLYIDFFLFFFHFVLLTVRLFMCNSVLFLSHCFASSWPGRSCKWELVLNWPTWLNKGEIKINKYIDLTWLIGCYINLNIIIRTTLGIGSTALKIPHRKVKHVFILYSIGWLKLLNCRFYKSW